MAPYHYNLFRMALCSLTLMLTLSAARAQTKIGGTAGPGDASAVLELQSTSQGLLPPRMSTTQRDAISSPATGLTIYNTTDNCIQVYKGAANGGWYNFCNATAGSFSFTNCGSPTITGSILERTPTTATIQLSYNNSTGQTSGIFAAGTVNGITASAPGGSIVAIAASGTLTLTLSGSPTTAGAMQLPVSVAGTVCDIPITVGPFPGNIPVACGTAPGCTGGVDPATAVAGDKICWGGFTYYAVATSNGRLWFDRNLGSRNVPTNTADQAGWGDDYQWGRKGDGHQCLSNTTTGTSLAASSSTLFTGDATNGNYIIGSFSTGYTWTSWSQVATLWDSSATGGPNNPCPTGWRVPTYKEWADAGTVGVDPFSTPLKLPGQKNRNWTTYPSDGSTRYYTVTPKASTYPQHYIVIVPSSGNTTGGNDGTEFAVGCPIRCIKHQ